MSSDSELKKVVKQKYTEIAEAETNSGCGCGCSSSKVVDYTIFQDDYSKLEGYVAEADLGLGCGVPTEFAGIKKGDTVVDLGSGAGNDIFVARALTGNEGHLIGIDFTESMIEKAKKNNAKIGFGNVEFKLGEIENIPLNDNSADVVISNCVLNLVPDKRTAFNEINRILKPGAHFCVSDIVIKGSLSPEFKKSAELYAGCVSGAVSQDEYLKIISDAGFVNVEIKQTKNIGLPDDILNKYLSEDEIKRFNEKLEGIFSITVVGYKK
jgi:ubiquinone/menaquinone biosynthesis C-methylase UbiE